MELQRGSTELINDPSLLNSSVQNAIRLSGDDQNNTKVHNEAIQM